MTKRGYIRSASFAFAFLLIITVFGISNYVYAREYKQKLENNYRQSLLELDESLGSIETNLTKSVYSNSGTMLYELSRDLYSECTTAKKALSRLPISQMNLQNTYKFLSQSADYASYLGNKLSSGEEISEEEAKNLSTLLNYSKKFSSAVSQMVSQCNNGAKITDRKVKNTQSNLSIAGISNDFTQSEETFKDYPTLLYDGPFADAVLNKEALVTKNEQYVTMEQAKEKASQILGVNADKLTYSGEEASKIPCYVFNYGHSTIAITKQGCRICYLLYGGKVNEQKITSEIAIGQAQNFLDENGYTGMANSYYSISNNICLINFSYSDMGIMFYPDLIKVGVNMSNGKVVTLECAGYLTNHYTRTDTVPGIDYNTALKKISPSLEAIDGRLCVIPKEDGTEKLCFEIHCKSKKTGDEVLVYINAKDGEEEDIMLLLYSDNGTLTK